MLPALTPHTLVLIHSVRFPGIAAIVSSSRKSRELWRSCVKKKAASETDSLFKSTCHKSHFGRVRPVFVSIPSVSRELVAIAFCRPPPPHQTFAHIEKFIHFCSAQWLSDLLSIVSAADSCYRQYRVCLHWPLTFWDTVFSLRW